VGKADHEPWRRGDKVAAFAHPTRSRQREGQSRLMSSSTTQAHRRHL
jgi:hypothetical protein